MDQLDFDAEIVKAQTMVDGGVRIVLELPEYELPSALRVIELKVKKPMVRINLKPKDET